MRTYSVKTYQDQATYTVTIDETGVISADGLPDDAVENMKASVARHMARNKLPAVTALGLVVGPYSTVRLVDAESVSDLSKEPGVS